MPAQMSDPWLGPSRETGMDPVMLMLDKKVTNTTNSVVDALLTHFLILCLTMNLICRWQSLMN